MLWVLGISSDDDVYINYQVHDSVRVADHGLNQTGLLYRPPLGLRVHPGCVLYELLQGAPDLPDHVLDAGHSLLTVLRWLHLTDIDMAHGILEFFLRCF